MVKGIIVGVRLSVDKLRACVLTTTTQRGPGLGRVQKPYVEVDLRRLGSNDDVTLVGIGRLDQQLLLRSIRVHGSARRWRFGRRLGLLVSAFLAHLQQLVQLITTLIGELRNAVEFLLFPRSRRTQGH